MTNHQHTSHVQQSHIALVFRFDGVQQTLSRVQTTANMLQLADAAVEQRHTSHVTRHLWLAGKMGRVRTSALACQIFQGK
jgi:hypothetical protein